MTHKVAVFGHYFLEVDGVSYLYSQLRKMAEVRTYYSIDAVFKYAQENPGAKIILIAELHTISYTLYQLAMQYPMIEILVVANGFYYSDLVILKTLGIKLNLTFNELIESFLKRELEPLFDTPNTDRVQYLPLLDRLQFRKYLNDVITRQLTEYGVTYKQTNILLRLFQGRTPHHIACELGISVKTVSTHKANALMKLPMGRSRGALTKGLWISIPV
ncbi:helix-turn-helix domain-containing protein [Yersinia ruckeri]|uniref:helix-turn-helix domain-containing protein n=1 Tax=Yersinia ruckeri TaxID=29486 RepID=UPI002238C28B|nr:helix-turn-helix transcriptional regulator [Yersinia ruckeri]MCW6569459.1 helix-turn-helix transcriptional regulator [Yersinia ruckeri]